MIPNADILFNDYGDIEIRNGDIAVLKNKILILRQNVVDRIKTSFGDYKLYKSYGADLASFIGKPQSSSLEEKITQNIIRNLTFDKFLEQSSIGIAIVDIEGIYIIKVEVSTDIAAAYSLTTLKINTIFNSINGVINVT